jgi:hypothetical protein
VARPVSFRFLFLSLFVLFCPFELSLNAPVKRDKKRQKRTKRERQKRMDAQSVYLAPTQALRRLAAFLDETGSKLTPLDAATMAINQWIATERDQFTDVTATPTRGYQWKSLFLPDGSELRVIFSGQAFYARVIGDKLIYDGWPVSPREFATKAAGAGRNAWREVWVSLPGECKWQPASLMRRMAEQAPPPKTVSPAEAMHAAAACMSETLKSALALVQHVSAQELLPVERRQVRARRTDDVLSHIAEDD